MTQPADAKAYYGYLFGADKKPTKVLDALLRSVAIYISENVGDKQEKSLTPTKLADFYREMGGNYDSLFVDVPHPSISWIYASIGCQHTFQPTSNDFKPPSVPALTTKGFVRWQSIEILLGPEEHVPFIQTAVKTWGLQNPDTGEAFPLDLPRDAFPLHCDKGIEKWHSECAAKLRQQANTDDEDHEFRRPDLPPRPKVRVQAGYSHVHARAPDHHPTRANTIHHIESRSRGSARPLSYAHVSGGGGRPVRPTLSRSPEYRPRQFLVPEERIPASLLSHGRRRSFPENLSSPLSSPNEKPETLHPPRAPHHVRRHSHPRHRHDSASEDASSEDEGPHSPRTTANLGASRQTSHHSSPVDEVAGSTRFNPAAPTSPDPRRERREREEELKRQSFPIPIDITGKLSAPFLLNRDRERERASRSGSRGVRWKDLSPDIWKSTSKESSQEEEPPSRHRHEDIRRRDRGSDRERDRARGRDPERDWDRRSRPNLAPRRPSSHNDISRSVRDRRDRDRDREYWDRDQRSFRDRDRERRAVSPIGGVNGRRYPAQA